MQDFDGKPSHGDIVNAYRLTAGRDPENERVIEDRLGQRNRVWFPPFFRSGEFATAIVAPIVRRAPLKGAWLGRPLPRSLAAWAADFIPLTPEGQAAARTAEDWHVLFDTLFGDPEFARRVVPGNGDPADPAFLAALAAHRRLRALSSVRGVVESAGDGEVRGWAVDIDDPDHTPMLELFIDGVFAGATSPDRPRPDLDRPGRPGFVLRYAASPLDMPAAIAEVRELASGVSLGTVQLPATRRAAIDTLTATRREIGELHATLARIEARLPALRHDLGYPLAAWDTYAASYCPDRPARSVRSVDAAAIVDARAGDTIALDAMLASLFAQSARPRTIVVLHDGGDFRLEAETVIAGWRRHFDGAAVLTGIPDDGDDLLAAAVADVAEGIALVVLAPGTLASDAVAKLVDAIGDGALLAYGDDDAVSRDCPTRRHTPRLRTAFDPDLLLQQDCLGPLAALVVGDPVDPGVAPIVARALRLHERGDAARIAHVPHVLFHRDTAISEATAGHHAAVRAVVARTMPGVEAVAHRDLQGAIVPGALSIVRTPPAATRVAIIIPTRDRLDLLGLCLDSIARTLAHNRVEIEVVVVDNRSAEAATQEFLADYHGLPRRRTIGYDGDFNWAAINNHAAAGIDADVLVFLNNDTAVLAPDCWDVLAAQALRPSVGAVGARLLYRDGTIQHAGMVMDPWHSFASHEGVGDAGSDPGYLGRHALVRQVSTVTGACLATRATLFHEVGGFDAATFPYEGNDVDYCLRLRDRGYDILYDPGATLYHFESRTRGYNDDDVKRRRAMLATRELRRRWAARFERDRFYNPHFDRLAPPCTHLSPPSADELRPDAAPASDGSHFK